MRGIGGSEDLGHRIIIIFNLRVASHVSAERLELASPVDADKLCPFAANLSSLAKSTGHRPGQATRPPQTSPSQIPSPRPLSPGSGRTAPAGITPAPSHTHTLASLALQGNIHRWIVRSRPPTAERPPRSHLHSRGTPWNR